MNSVPGIDALPADIAPQIEKTATPPLPPPAELVGRFEQMMQQTPTSAADSSASSVSNSPVAAALVHRLEQHLDGHAQAMERVASMDPSSMSSAEIDKIQVESMVQMGLLSMNQMAVFEVLGSTKSAVSSLMKNQ